MHMLFACIKVASSVSCRGDCDITQSLSSAFSPKASVLLPNCYCVPNHPSTHPSMHRPIKLKRSVICLANDLWLFLLGYLFCLFCPFFSLTQFFCRQGSELIASVLVVPDLTYLAVCLIIPGIFISLSCAVLFSDRMAEIIGRVSISLFVYLSLCLSLCLFLLDETLLNVWILNA